MNVDSAKYCDSLLSLLITASSTWLKLKFYNDTYTVAVSFQCYLVISYIHTLNRNCCVATRKFSELLKGLNILRNAILENGTFSVSLIPKLCNLSGISVHQSPTIAPTLSKQSVSVIVTEFAVQKL